MSENPLSSLYRHKTIFLALPSNGKFYRSGINLSVDNELGIMPMSVRDELLLKSPDSLFNGEAMIEVIKSCVPDIKNPEDVPVCDIDTIILGIRAASNPEMEVISECPACKKESRFIVNLLSYISTVKRIPDDNTIKANQETILELKPYTLKTLMKRRLQEFKFTKMEQSMRSMIKGNKSEEINEELLENIKKSLNDAYEDTAKITVEIVAESITKVTMTDRNIEVSDPDHILDWVKNMDKNLYHKIVNKISELNDNNIQKTTDTKCPNCNTSYKTTMEVNPVNFFTKE